MWFSCNSFAALVNEIRWPVGPHAELYVLHKYKSYVVPRNDLKMIEFLRKIFFVRLRCRVFPPVWKLECNLLCYMRPISIIIIGLNQWISHEYIRNTTHGYDYGNWAICMFGCKTLARFFFVLAWSCSFFLQFIFPSCRHPHRHRHRHQLVLLSLCLIFCVIILVTHILTHKNEYIQLIMPHYFSSFIFILLGKRLQKEPHVEGVRQQYSNVVVVVVYRIVWWLKSVYSVCGVVFVSDKKKR